MKNRSRKVPSVNALFWTIKILSTAMGEALSDYLVATINPIYAVILGAIGFITALAIQLTAKKYTPWKYWLAVSMVAVFGTMMADVLHIGLGIPYVASSTLFAAILLLIFIFWYKTEKTLSIHSITSLRKEIFYWLTVSATFALGTAVGDLTATTFMLGYLVSGVVFAILILVPLFAYYKLKFNEVAAFWIAYILTRPLGASFADWFGKSHQLGGIGLGDGPISVILIILIIGLVYLHARKNSKLIH